MSVQFLLSLCLLLIGVASVQASHFRFGLMNWSQDDENVSLRGATSPGVRAPTFHLSRVSTQHKTQKLYIPQAARITSYTLNCTPHAAHHEHLCACARVVRRLFVTALHHSLSPTGCSLQLNVNNVK
jgi:hypothetical protein